MENIFTNIYENKIWGDNNINNYNGSSGGGSDIDYNKDTYIPFLKKLIIDNNITNITDLGCGDLSIYNKKKNSVVDEVIPVAKVIAEVIEKVIAEVVPVTEVVPVPKLKLNKKIEFKSKQKVNKININ